MQTQAAHVFHPDGDGRERYTLYSPIPMKRPSPSECLCKIDELACRASLEKAATIPDRTQRERTVELIQATHKIIEETILPSHACDSCPHRKR